MRFDSDILASGTITAPSGIFFDTLTISGVPVATGTGGGGGSASTLQDAYDNGDGVIATTVGKPVVISGTEYDADADFKVIGSGIFTEGLQVGSGTAYVTTDTITIDSGFYSFLEVAEPQITIPIASPEILLIQGLENASSFNTSSTTYQDSLETGTLLNGVNYLVMYAASVGSTNGGDPDARIIFNESGGGEIEIAISASRAQNSNDSEKNVGPRLQGFTVITGDTSAGQSSTIKFQLRDGTGARTAHLSKASLVCIPLDTTSRLITDTDVFYEVQNSLSQTRSNVPTTFGGATNEILESTFNVPDTGNYFYLASVEGKCSTGTANGPRAQFSVDGSPVSPEYVRESPISGGEAEVHFIHISRVNLTAGNHTFLIEGASRAAANADFRRARNILLRADSFDQTHYDTTTQGVGFDQTTYQNVFSSPLLFTHTPAQSEDVLILSNVIGNVGLPSARTAIQQLYDATNAIGYRVDSGQAIVDGGGTSTTTTSFSPGSDNDNIPVLLMHVDEDVTTTKTWRWQGRRGVAGGGFETISFGKLPGGAATTSYLLGLSLSPGSGPGGGGATPIERTAISGTSMTTPALGANVVVAVSGSFDNLTVGGVPIELGVTDPLNIGTVNVSTSLTISGEPVSTGTGGGASTLQDAYDGGDGTISTTGGKPFALAGTGELTAVTGTFTDGLTIGSASTFIDGGSITTVTGTFETLTISGVSVVAGGGGGSALTVKEAAGSPSVANVDTIVVSNGTLIDNGGGQVTIQTGGTGGGGGGTTSGTLEFRGALLTTSSGSSVPDGGDAFIAWDVSEYDTDGFFSASNAGRLTIPAGINKVQTIASIRWDDNTPDADGTERLFYTIHWDSAGTIKDYYSLTVVPGTPTSSNESTGQTTQTPVIDVVEGDYFQTWIRQQSGSTLSINSAPGNVSFFALEVKDPVTATGIVTGGGVSDPLVLASGVFSESLTISGVPVSTGTGGGSANTLQDAYDNGDGTISTTGGKPFELTGTGELVAVTGTFTSGLTVGGASTLIDGGSITTASGIFETLTVSGVPVNTNPLTGKASFRGARVELAVDQTVTTATSHQVIYDTTIFDTEGFVVGGDQSYLVVPEGVSKIRLRSQTYWISNNVGIRQNNIRKGTFPGAGGFGAAIWEGFAQSSMQATSPVIDVAPGDQFSVLARQESGGNLNLDGSTVSLTWFEVEVIEDQQDWIVDEFTATSGTFSQSLTVSGVPVSTGTVNTELTGVLLTTGNQFLVDDDPSLVLDWTTEVYDIGGWHTATAGPTVSGHRITIPPGVAYASFTYQLQVTASGTPAATAIINSKLRKNGETLYPFSVGVTTPANLGASNGTIVHADSPPLPVVAGDYFEVDLKIVAYTINAGTGGTRCFFSAKKEA